jgi:hypothetical protein
MVHERCYKNVREDGAMPKSGCTAGSNIMLAGCLSWLLVNVQQHWLITAHRPSGFSTPLTCSCIFKKHSGARKIFVRRLYYTPSVLVIQVILDKAQVKYWKYKSWITFKLLSLKIWKLMNRFVLKSTFIKIYICHFPINIFIKIRSQTYVLETVSLSKRRELPI